jgi:hypothetical protein
MLYTCRALMRRSAVPMTREDTIVELEAAQFLASMVYQADPLARFLIERLKLGKYKAALAGLAWGLVYLVVLPLIFGGLWSKGAYLGSLQDWHAQLLLLLVFPATCAFYLWQPGAIARVYEPILSGDPSHDVGRLFCKGIWQYLSLLPALAIVLFDAPKMIASYGSWWMTQNYLTIAWREASLAVAFYMMSTMAWRQLIAINEWNRLLAKPTTAPVLRVVTDYGLSCAFLFALLGLRLGVEGIELPQRAGTITPDYYVYGLKIATYIVVSLGFFFAPLARIRRKGVRISLSQAITLLKLVGIMALPLVAFVVLKLVQ